MKLIEFKNHFENILRGVINEIDAEKAIICAHGFERTLAEYKFKNIYEKLKNEYLILRFDFSGCVLSEGVFEDITVRKRSRELNAAYETLIELHSNLKEICVIGHSLSGCTINQWMIENNPDSVSKIIYFGPAWNQRELLKYFFVREQFKGKANITWQNYRRYFDEKAYAENLKIKKRMRKAHYISDNYFKENFEKDYSESVNQIRVKKLSVHGTKDIKVPIKSINYNELDIELIKVRNGDHDLEKPEMVDQYLNKLVDFIRL
jgi:pimeloyl-ACP methyl ester carboxylesterase